MPDALRILLTMLVIRRFHSQELSPIYPRKASGLPNKPILAE